MQQQAAEVPANGDDQEQMDTISVQATVQQAASSIRTRIYSNLDPLLLAAPSKNRDPDQSAIDADVRGQLKRYTPEFPDLEPRAKSGAHKPPPKLQPAFTERQGWKGSSFKQRLQEVTNQAQGSRPYMRNFWIWCHSGKG